MVLRESLIMVAVGTVIGIGAALAAGRLVATMLFGLRPSRCRHEIAIAIGVLATVSLFARYVARPPRLSCGSDGGFAL